jgi:hypothetical protein
VGKGVDDELFIGGDHGNHFAQRATMCDESTFYRRFGITVHPLFLCSYHAYSRCDTAGSADSREKTERDRIGAGPTTGADMARMVNENPDPASVAFPFTHIARNKDMIKTDAQMRAVTTSTCTQPPHTYTRTIRTIPTTYTMHVTLGPTPAQFHKHTCITLASAHMHTCTNPHTHTNTHQLTRTDTNTHNHTHTSRHVVLARGARSCTLGRVRRMVTVKG